MHRLWLQKGIHFTGLALCLIAGQVLAQMGGNMGMQPPSSTGLGPDNSMSQSGEQTMGMSGQQNGLNRLAEQEFLQYLSKNSQAAMEISQTALKNSSNKSIQDLAQSVIKGHQKMAVDIADIASQRKVSLSNSISGHARKDEKKLQALTGSQFDRVYLKQLDHLVKNEENSASNALTSTDAADLRPLAMGAQSQAKNDARKITEISKAENISLK